MATLTGWATEEILRVIEQGETSLNLSGLGQDRHLKEVPRELRNLTRLEQLDLSQNQISHIPDWLGELENLRILDLSGNKIKSIPLTTVRLENLVMLDMSGNGITKLPSWIGRISSLERLYLGGNQLSSISDLAGSLVNLKELGLSGNRLATLPTWFSKLTELRVLYLSENNLKTLPSFLGQLTNLEELDVSNNQLAELPNSVSFMLNLRELRLSSNQLTTMPDLFGQLANLQELDLGDNHLTTLEGTLDNFTKLRVLDISQNNLKSLPRSIATIPSLIELEVSDNPLSDPPIEVADRGINGVREYFRQASESGLDSLYEAKLLVVGEPGAGKTTLKRRIGNPNAPMPKAGESTHGIEVSRWDFPMPNQTRKFRVNVWDFGGQEIYHATHQFFLTKRSLYALVANGRREDSDFYYWLRLVETLSDGSPVLIVNNVLSDRRGEEIPTELLRQVFSGFKEVVTADLSKPEELVKLQTAVQYHIQKLSHIGSKLPKTWVRVREELESNPKNFVSKDEYLAICKANGFATNQDALQLSGYLHDLGVHLHFQDNPILNEVVILKPTWATIAVYRVLDNARIRDSFGQFTRTEINEIWHESEYKSHHEVLLELMSEFGLCYRVDYVNRHTFIAPQLLSPTQPTTYTWDTNDNLHLRYKYERFMPKGILSRFIVSAAGDDLLVNEQMVWKTGAVVKLQTTQAQVIESYLDSEISIRIRGPQKRDLLAIVMSKLDAIHAAYPGLNFSKHVPCNCAECKSSKQPHFFNYELLQNAERRNRTTIQCGISFEDVFVRQLIEDVFLPTKDSRWLRDILGKKFNKDDIRNLCLEMDIDYESLRDDTLAVMARELVEYCSNRDLLDSLTRQVLRARPNAALS